MNSEPSRREEELRELQNRWEQLTEIPDTPDTSMEIIEYSLGSQRRAEVYTNRLLRYFLNPETSHRMEEDFLKTFLQTLPAECSFEEDVHDLSDVRVREQVQVGGYRTSDERTGDVDIVIDVPNEWFLLIELKFSANEGNLLGSGLTQTEFYYDTDTIYGVDKEEYKSGHYYLYIHQGATAKEPAFTNWGWDELLDDVVAPVLVKNSSRYPLRTVAQLREFIDDIENITGMSDEQQNKQEKVELYLDHRNAIEDVRKSFNDRWERFADEWGPRLADKLESSGAIKHHDTERSNVVVEIPKRSQWVLHNKDDDWGHIFKDGWWRHLDNLDGSISRRPDDGNDVRIGFHHRLGGNRDFAIDERTLKVCFRNMGANDDEFITEFTNQFKGRDMNAHLTPSAVLTGNKLNLLEATYDIRVDEHDDFFDAYVGALHRAFMDLVVENEELIIRIDDAFEEALTTVYR